jgi:hypothetical protein
MKLLAWNLMLLCQELTITMYWEEQRAWNQKAWLAQKSVERGGQAHVPVSDCLDSSSGPIIYAV